MMRRRDFITMLGVAAAWPLVARAQQPERLRRIGVLSALAENDPEAKGWLIAFREGLQKLGWEPDRNIQIIDYRFTAGDEDRLGTLAAELVGMAPDVLLSVGAIPLSVLHRQTRSLPIVFVQVADPVKLGVVASLARPAGNITGFASFEHGIASKWLELLKDTAPGTARVAVIFDPANPFQSPYLQAVEAAAPTFGMQLTRAGVRNAAEIESAITAFAQQPNAALIVAPNTVAIPNRDLIIALAARYRLPAVYPYRFFARSGGFISYGTDLADQYRQAAGYVDRILKGAKPGDLPVQLAAKFEMIINLKTAKALGLDVPDKLVALADEVIE